MDNQVEEVKSRVDIVELVGQYVTLKKSGGNYRGLCPFHTERTPSFFVSSERGSYKCFGCGKGGDALNFLMEIEHLSFPEALKMLADRAGVRLLSNMIPKKEEDRKSRLYALNRFAAALFHKILVEHASAKEARAYLGRRAISGESIQRFNLGFAPPTKMLEAIFLKRGFALEELRAAGNPERFFNRLIFPLTDALGNVVGFTGRVLGQGEPKYLNTSDTAIFKKHRMLYGLETAKQAIRAAGYAVVVEGQTDVIAAQQAGNENVVAASGTALGEEHLQIIARYADTVVFALDSDAAGLAATRRALDLALKRGLNVKILALAGKDPAEVIEREPASWRKALEAPERIIEFYVRSEKAKMKNPLKPTVEEKKTAAKELIAQIRKMPDPIERAHWSQEVAAWLGVPGETVLKAVETPAKGRSWPSSRISPTPAYRAAAEQPAARAASKTDALETVLTILAAYQTEIPFAARTLPPAQIRRFPQGALYQEVIQEYTEKRALGEATLDRISVPGAPTFADAEAHDALVSALLIVKRAASEALKQQFAQKLKVAEKAGDAKLIKTILQELQTALHEESSAESH